MATPLHTFYKTVNPTCSWCDIQDIELPLFPSDYVFKAYLFREGVSKIFISSVIQIHRQDNCKSGVFIQFALYQNFPFMILHDLVAD